jgi:formylglycine-generating enzyme required for sulfatase activity
VPTFTEISYGPVHVVDRRDVFAGRRGGRQGAETPEVQFQKLYGEDAAKASRSPASKEAVAFVAKLLTDAGTLKGDPAMTRLMLDKAYELGCKSAEGCPTAIQAARIRMDQEADNKLPWRDKLLEACRIQYQKAKAPDKPQAGDTLIGELTNVADALTETGNFAEAVKPLQECRQVAATTKSSRLDDITDRLKAVNGKIDVEKKFSAYAKRLVDNPQDAATAKAAVMLCIVQLDDPGKAAGYADATGDDELKKLVPLAAQDVEKLTEDDCVALAAWYQTLAKKADRVSKLALLTRTKKCYEKILDKHSDDAQGIKLRKEMDELAKEIAALTLIGRELVLDLGKSVKMKLVRIPAGQFIMGGDEFPRHPVTLTKAFYMGVTAVTQEQYEQVMSKNPSGFNGAKNPVETVSWDNAVDFCKKLSTKSGMNVQLPTEAQWEYACRAGSKGKYCFGDDGKLLGEYAWYKDNSDEKTHPVAQKKPNAWGLYEMNGNVWEWCNDWFDDKYYTLSPKTDPTGPASGTVRVLRGGRWNVAPQFCGSAYRNSAPSEIRSNNLGFRVSVALK